MDRNHQYYTYFDDLIGCELTTKDRNIGVSFMKHAGFVSVWFYSHTFHFIWRYPNMQFWGHRKDDNGFGYDFGLGTVVCVLS